MASFNRDTAVRTFVGGIFGMSDVGYSATTEIPPTWDAMLNANARYFATLHPDGWPYLREVTELTGQTDSIEIQTLDTSLSPRTYGIKSVLAKRGTTSSYRVISFVPWEEMILKPEFNKTEATAETGENPKYYTIKFDGQSNKVCLELYPYSYQTVGKKNISLQITYLRSMPTISSTDPDAGYIWPEVYDSFFNWVMAADVAIVRNMPDRYSMCRQEAEAMAMQFLIAEGVSADKIKFPKRDMLADTLTFALNRKGQ